MHVGLDVTRAKRRYLECYLVVDFGIIADLRKSR
jgi:hypothetical protein